MKGGEKTYEQRITSNIGEELFEAYCAKQGYHFNRIGFDEQNGYVPNFQKLNPLLRNLPDYVVNTGEDTYVVCVKGTANIKKKEVDLLPLMGEWFSSRNAPLVYVFCFEGKKPILMYPSKVIELYEKGFDKKWNDGVVYRTLEIE